jgi:hypothetical protein
MHTVGSSQGLNLDPVGFRVHLVSSRGGVLGLNAIGGPSTQLSLAIYACNKPQTHIRSVLDIW